MKSIIVKCLAVIVLIVLGIGCAREKEMQPAYVDTLLSAGQVVPLSGHLYREAFWGPPGYGESPEIDTKEFAYILVLDHSIAFKNQAGDISSNVREVHIVFPVGIQPGYKAQTYCGQLDEGLTGHHRRNIMFYVK